MMLLLHGLAVSEAIGDLLQTISLLIAKSSLFSHSSSLFDSSVHFYSCLSFHRNLLFPLTLDAHSSLIHWNGNCTAAEDELPQLQQVLKLPLSPSAVNSMSGGQNGREAVGDPLRPQHERTSSPSHQDPAGSFPAPGSSSSHPHERIQQSSRNYNLLQSFYEDKQRTLCGDKEGMPLIVSINRSVSAIADRPISLVAEFCCHPRPRKVFWIHRHLALAPGRIIGPYITKDLVPVSNICILTPESELRLTT